MKRRENEKFLLCFIHYHGSKRALNISPSAVPVNPYSSVTSRARKQINIQYLEFEEEEIKWFFNINTEADLDKVKQELNTRK